VQRKFRLTRSEDFKRVRRSGKSYAHPLVLLIVETRSQPQLKVGVAAGKSVGTAVDRNRAKRLLREAMRTLIPRTASNADLLLIARPALVSASLEEVQEALAALLGRAQMLSVPAHES
jgi:ribonuclease P protein component